MVLKKPSRSRRRSVLKNKRKSVVFVLLLFLVVLLTALITYTVFIFPKILNNNIKDDLISLYNPRNYDDTANLLVLALTLKPSYDIQKLVYDEIHKKYGLMIRFKKISNVGNNGINKLIFFSLQSLGEELL